VYVAHLSLHDFRSYEALDLAWTPGVTVLLGRNGMGKTNIVEAVDYLARLGSHRVAGDAPLVRQGAARAVVRAAVVRGDRQALVEVEINPGSANRARLNRSPVPRVRDVLGLVRTVLFAPEDLALVKGDPGGRRGFLDDLLLLRAPRLAGVRAEYDRALRQRNALLRSARQNRARRRPDEHVASTLDVWDQQLSRAGAELVAARQALVADLEPYVALAYAAVAKDAGRDQATMRYQPSFPLPLPDRPPDQPPGQHDVRAALLAELERRRDEELDRGVTLAGPHRDELALALGTLPVRGYASHGESWSFALALRLASYDLLRAGGDDPVLVLDDVFAELDTGRRDRLADLVADAEQVLVTAAVPGDVPEALRGARYLLADGRVTAA
jgi:DNA replication and repair protein RecF